MSRQTFRAEIIIKGLPEWVGLNWALPGHVQRRLPGEHRAELSRGFEAVTGILARFSTLWEESRSLKLGVSSDLGVSNDVASAQRWLKDDKRRGRNTRRGRILLAR